MSPDWAAKAQPVPYAKLDNPQTLNLYSYVGNNPLSQIDADGHFASPWHFFISFVAAIATDHDVVTSVRLAWQNVKKDIGTQSGSASDVATHAMAVKGQSPDAAYDATQAKVSSEQAAGDQGGVQHTVDDSYAWGHNYSEWTGSYKDLGFWGTVKHEVGDFLPTPWTVVRAIAASMRALQDPNADPTTLLNHPPGGSNPSPAPPPQRPNLMPQCIGCAGPPRPLDETKQKQ